MYYYRDTMHHVLELEHLLHDESAEPRQLPLYVLEDVTNNFADDRKICEDGFSVGYRGKLRKGNVTVIDIDVQRFQNEIDCIKRMRAKHKNIVRFLGYCAVKQESLSNGKGRFFYATLMKGLLCFEYPNGGKLDAYITDACRGLGWGYRYKIIKGICEGLCYLHQNLTVHLNLKPANIWLDENMVPKIYDFGGSRRLEEKQSEVIIEDPIGTPGYIAPELLDRMAVTLKTDIYSLGVVITEILIGPQEYSIEDLKAFGMEIVLESWGDRFGTSLEDTRLEQIRVCAEIAKSCLEDDPEKRPDAEHIIEMLVETESMDGFTESDAQTMDYEVPSSMYDALERLLLDESVKPRELPLLLLRAITDGFAIHQKIDEGEYFVLYKGVLPSGKLVAVKKISEELEDEIFDSDYGFFRGMKHKNIVRLLGYCAEGRLLCLEYPSGGILDAYITDASQGFSWRKRYKIIKGICEGYYYLHRIGTVHLDLKPGNIWLDEKKAPKIHVSILAERYMGTKGYMAPKFLANGADSWRVDIYSLGVLITEILTGQIEISSLNKAVKSWAQRLLGTSLEDPHFEQIQVCANIVKSCLEEEKPDQRPHIEHIIQMLVETESTNEFAELDEMESADEFTPDEQTMDLNILERVITGSEEPRPLDLSLLQSITENFSELRKIGVGGCGEVYKGILRNGDVAVKRLFKSRTIGDKIFHREVKSLITVRHENIVRLLGYCSFTEEQVLLFQGRTIMVDIRERLLCFEYISNGNLENHLTDELRGLEWHTRYQIIMGICKGLFYLHKEKDIIHMDLKPSNILLDDCMVPKITDFGLSRSDDNSHTKTSSRLISLGYSAPEYREEGKSSRKSDIYSLGVIITELVTGTRNNPDLSKVRRRWRHRWIKSSKHTPLGYQQVTKCLRLAQRCIQINPTARPNIEYIMDELNTTDSKGGQEIPSLEDMLGIKPLEIHFPFKLDPQISHSIELTNNTVGYIAFMTKASSRRFGIEPDKGIVPPRSKGSITVTMEAQVNTLPNNRYKEEITVLSTTVDGGGLAAMDITGDVFTENEEGTMVDEVNVMVVFDKPPSTEES